MIFDKEPWKIAKDREARNYCGVVPNLVMVHPERRKQYVVYIQIPSELFAFLRRVLNVAADDMERKPVAFFLEQEKDVWYFAVKLPNDDVIDLWGYKDLPPWAMTLV